MPKAIMKCRVCGKEYEACRSAKTATGVFRWQEVACSAECGAEYLRRINESRGLVPKKVAELVEADVVVKRSARKKSSEKKQERPEVTTLRLEAEDVTTKEDDTMDDE